MEEDARPRPSVHPPAKSDKNLIISAVIAVALIGGAIFWQQTMAAKQPAVPTRTFSTEELREFDGKDAAPCYVGVDGMVYEIEQGRLWQGGKHESSEGRAECGRDLSAVIGQSPHGKSKLSTLTVVGRLAN